MSKGKKVLNNSEVLNHEIVEKKKVKKPLPTGVDDFLKLRKESYFYIDKTLMIKDLLNTKGEVNVFTRPRRFGKSLNISMLKYYFDILHKNDASVFNGLAITEAGEQYTVHQSQYPVIILTMKETEGDNFESAFDELKAIVADEYTRHRYLLESSILMNHEKAYFNRILETTGSQGDFKRSLKNLSKYLERHYNQKVIILIDEYDVPLEKAHFNNYYEEMVFFIRGFLGGALKSNTALHKAVITGCLRVSKESIFTGTNNPDMISIISKHYDEYFGFTEAEIEDIFKYYEIQNQLEIAKHWYNGYLFGDTIVYNPWSIIKYVKDLLKNDIIPKPHWSNTSSNSIVRDLIEHADDGVKGEIEHLMTGGTITKAIQEDIVYAEIMDNMNNLWNFLFFTGYLTKVSQYMEEQTLYYTFKIPNLETLYIYENHIIKWFNEKFIKKMDFKPLYEAILTGAISTFEEKISDLLVETISYFDSKEAFYHGFLSGILTTMQGYRTVSNREAGSGRADLFLKPRSVRKTAFIIEIKIADDIDKLESAAQSALTQITKKNYKEELWVEGYRDIVMYAIAFFRKDCLVLKGE